MTIDPLLVDIVAEYRLDKSMHIGGGASKCRIFFPEPSGGGHSMVMVMAPFLLGRDGAARCPPTSSCGNPHPGVWLMVTLMMRWVTLGGIPLLADVPP